MSAEERAREYAKLFTRVGDRWRYCAPVDGKVDARKDRMELDGVVIERRAGADRWALRPGG